MGSILTEQQLQKIIDQTWADTQDRKKGSFKRALWYGNNSSIFGQNKGARKLIRNTPRKALTFGIGKIPALGDALGFITDPLLNAGKSLYSSKVKPHIKVKPRSDAEKARKNIKKEVKDLKNNAVSVIDRNLVKLRDARAGMKPKLDAFMQSQGESAENRSKHAEALIRQIFEAYYYEDKILGLTGNLRQALERIDEDVDKLHADTLKLYWDVTDVLLTDFE